MMEGFGKEYFTVLILIESFRLSARMNPFGRVKSPDIAIGVPTGMSGIEPTISRRRYIEIYIEKLTDIGETLLKLKKAWLNQL